jgi:acetyl esterase/lipase
MSDHTKIVVERDQIYVEGTRPLRWNLFHPATVTTKSPAVLLYHGGGWRGGDRASMTAACSAFASLGYVAIAPEYRLLGEAPWPAPLTDTRTAIRAAKAKADLLGISPDQIFLTGYSAGAQLALIASSGVAGPPNSNEPYANQSETVAGVAAFFTPTRIEAHHGVSLGISDPEMLVSMSPITHAGCYPPTILFCGDSDTMTPPELSLELYRAIRKAGGIADLRLYSNLIHEFVSLPGMMQTTISDAAAFFARTVLNKAAFESSLGKLYQWWDRIKAQT